MRRSLPLLASLALLPAASAAPPADPVDAYVRETIARRGIPGVSIAIAKDGSIVRAQGWGLANVELDVPAAADTIYQSGSLGKQFTAAGILLLAEEGRLSLDDPLSKHFADAPPAWGGLRVRHLLAHTSGLKDYGAEELDLRRDYSEAELFAAMAKLPLEFEPGMQWSYSNSGYLVLGLLTSKLAGRHWSAFQAERIFAPLGMTRTRMISERDIVPKRAAGYVLDAQGELKNQDWVSPSINSCADGALYLTVLDLAAWDAALRARRLLAPASFEAWWTPAPLADGTTWPYGFGWELSEQRGHPLLEHGGAWQGFRSAIARYEEQGLAIAVLANLAQAAPETMAHEIAGLVEPALRLPDASTSAGGEDPAPERAARLRGVLESFAAMRPSPEMARGLRAAQAGSARVAEERRQTAERLQALTAFRYLGEDDLALRPLSRRGERVVQIVHYALETRDARHVYRFYLTDDGRVADFGSEER